MVDVVVDVQRVGLDEGEEEGEVSRGPALCLPDILQRVSASAHTVQVIGAVGGKPEVVDDVGAEVRVRDVLVGEGHILYPLARILLDKVGGAPGGEHKKIPVQVLLPHLHDVEGHGLRATRVSDEAFAGGDAANGTGRGLVLESLTIAERRPMSSLLDDHGAEEAEVVELDGALNCGKV